MTFSRWWQLKYVLFSPRKLGQWSNLTHIFQMGWFNHQLVDFFCCKKSIDFRSNAWRAPVIPLHVEGVWKPRPPPCDHLRSCHIWQDFCWSLVLRIWKSYWRIISFISFILLMEDILHQLIARFFPLFTRFYTSQVVQDFFHQEDHSSNKFQVVV